MASTRDSLMTMFRAMDKRASEESRLVYITTIMYKLRLSESTLIPTVAEERSFEEALRHVVRVVSNDAFAPLEGSCSCVLNACSTTRDRKQCLKKMYDQLCWIERRRLYDPPPVDEIGHYLLIKKYTRSILTYNLAAARDTSTHPEGIFGCSSLYNTLHYAETLLEMNRYLGDLSEILLEMNFEDGFTLAALVGIKDSNEIVPISCGSKEKSYMFYGHKFQLASADLRYSEFPYCPPFEDEERCYAHVSHDIATPIALIGVEDETNVYSEELFNLYLERIYQEMVNIEGHFAKIKGWILKTLFLGDRWETVAQHTKSIEYYEYEDHERDEFRKQLADNCEVSSKDLPDYISQVDHCLVIALLVVVSVVVSAEKRADFTQFRASHSWKKAGWEALHFLSLFKHGSYAASVLQERPIMRNPLKLATLENHQATRKNENIIHGKGQDGNIIILEVIIDNLRCIRDSHIELDKEEMTLVHKIWGSVASSYHFFVSAIAYEQRRYVTQHRELFDLVSKNLCMQSYLYHQALDASMVVFVGPTISKIRDALLVDENILLISSIYAPQFIPVCNMIVI